jgi:hypothetical protein
MTPHEVRDWCWHAQRYLLRAMHEVTLPQAALVEDTITNLQRLVLAIPHDNAPPSKR